MNTRIESDSIGSMPVDENAYYGVQSLRAKENFPITGHLLTHEFIVNLALIKEACAITNQEASLLEKDKAESIIKACKEVEKGLFDNQFITDEIQGGAGTSMNMNMNEVIANRANEILGGKLL